MATYKKDVLVLYKKEPMNPISRYDVDKVHPGWKLTKTDTGLYTIWVKIDYKDFIANESKYSKKELFSRKDYRKNGYTLGTITIEVPDDKLEIIVTDVFENKCGE